MYVSIYYAAADVASHCRTVRRWPAWKTSAGPTVASSCFLYVKNSTQGTVTSFRIANDGSLVRIDSDEDGQGFGSIGIAAQ